MPVLTRIIGAGLIVLGLGAFLGSGADSPTALLPALLGAVLVALGVVAGRESARRHTMHAALLVAVLGIAGTAMNLAEIPELLRGEAERPLAVAVSAVTALALAVYVAMGIRSFVTARRSSAA